MSQNAYLAFDLGAESGRAMLGTLENERLQLEQLHRFPNLPQKLPDGWHWDLLGLWANLRQGLRQAAQTVTQRQLRLVSLGVDTWGVDFGLIGRSGQLLGLPFCYRDPRSGPAMRQAFDRVGARAIYMATGIQHMPLNSLYQLVAQHAAEPHTLQHAQRMLLMPDLLHYFFTGVAVNEATIASTAQMVDPHSGRWATELLEQLGLPTSFLDSITPAGTDIGPVQPEGLAGTGMRELRVILPGSHDTASAVAAVPVDESAGQNWAYLSSGTWSLMGAELDAPVVNDASFAASFTNERGVGNKVRFLKNIAGLWLVQECRRDLAARGQELNYAQLTELAAQAEPFRTLVDPDHAPFATPGGMLQKITDYARATGQPEPEAPGQYVRCCLESLALTYRRVLEKLEALLGRRIEVLHIVGGGGQNALLNQMTADAIGRRVIVGPYEATAVGNALTQAMGAHQVRDLAHLRGIVRNSFDLLTCEPREPETFTRQISRFAALLGP